MATLPPNGHLTRLQPAAAPPLTAAGAGAGGAGPSEERQLMVEGLPKEQERLMTAAITPFVGFGSVADLLAAMHAHQPRHCNLLLPIEVAVIAVQLLLALSIMHIAGCAHLDVNPHNILIDRITLIRQSELDSPEHPPFIVSDRREFEMAEGVGQTIHPSQLWPSVQRDQDTTTAASGEDEGARSSSRNDDGDCSATPSAKRSRRSAAASAETEVQDQHSTWARVMEHIRKDYEEQARAITARRASGWNSAMVPEVDPVVIVPHCVVTGLGQAAGINAIGSVINRCRDPHFAAPEVWRRDLSLERLPSAPVHAPSCDAFSAGASIYTLAAGNFPWAAYSADVTYAHQHVGHAIAGNAPMTTPLPPEPVSHPWLASLTAGLMSQNAVGPAASRLTIGQALIHPFITSTINPRLDPDCQNNLFAVANAASAVEDVASMHRGWAVRELRDNTVAPLTYAMTLMRAWSRPDPEAAQMAGVDVADGVDGGTAAEGGHGDDDAATTAAAAENDGSSQLPSPIGSPAASRATIMTPSAAGSRSMSREHSGTAGSPASTVGVSSPVDSSSH